MRPAHPLVAVAISSALAVGCTALEGLEDVPGTSGDGGAFDGPADGDSGDGAPGPCTPGAKQCDGNAVVTCGSSGQWGSPAVCTNQACVDGACTGVCAPGATQCSSESVQICGANGQWAAGTACPQPTPDCSGGVCTCAGSTCGDSCVNEQTDDANCGGCGLACSTGCNAGECLVTLALQQDSPQGIALDATHVYWAAGNVVMSAPLAGGAPTTLATGSHPQAIALDAVNVYWTDPGDGTVMSVPIAGGTATTLASGQNGPNYFTVDATNV